MPLTKEEYIKQRKKETAKIQKILRHECAQQINKVKEKCQSLKTIINEMKIELVSAGVEQQVVDSSFVAIIEEIDGLITEADKLLKHINLYQDVQKIDMLVVQN